MSAPAPAVGVVPTSATTKRIEAQAELTGLQRKLNAIPAAIERLDERIAAGDQAAIQEQARLRVEALHLPGKIAVLEPRVRALVADEERLRLTLFAERQQREYAESREAVASTFAALRGALYDAAVKAGFHRRNVEVLARREAALHLGEPERERIVRSRDSAAAYVLKFAEALSRHLDGLPTPERELLDRVTDAEMGDALRSAHDGFHHQ